MFLPILIFHCKRRGSSIAEGSGHKLLQRPENNVNKESTTCTVHTEVAVKSWAQVHVQYQLLQGKE